MITTSKSHIRMAISYIIFLLVFTTPLSSAAAQNCSTNCLSVYSIALTNLGTSIRGIVKLTDETGSGAGARGAVVHAVWTRPDGSTFDQYANIGTRLRAEFKLYTAGISGRYKLTVVNTTKAGYTFDPQNSTTLSKSIQVGTGSNQPPIAVSNADVTSGSAPLTVNFDSYGSSDPDGVITTYAWNFGDGSSSTEANPLHTYTDVGNYTATLLVTDNMGASGSSTTSIMVTDSNAGCTSNCISVDNVSLKYQKKSNRIKGVISIVDENGSSVKRAIIHAVWTRPDGLKVDDYSTSNKHSLAKFFLIPDTAGEYILTVISVSKDGLTFDPDSSNVLSGIIVIAP